MVFCWDYSLGARLRMLIDMRDVGARLLIGSLMLVRGLQPPCPKMVAPLVGSARTGLMQGVAR